MIFIFFCLIVKKLMIAKNSVMKIQNLIVNHKSRPSKSNPEISYFQKNLLHEMAVLGYVRKLKRCLGLVFCVNFLNDFSMKMFLI